ncbi:NDR1/HIN1-like protein 13 [Typha latifolia]|uniref:NDR1/HIN1-like protein 13 n=1 Tax=Typha latifolia TaxID=4733 RepID=UPI003C2AEE3B
MSSAIPSPPPTPTFLHLRTRFRVRPTRNPHLHRAAKLICASVLFFLFAAAFLLFLLYLALRPHRPRFHVSTFSATGLSSSSPAPTFNTQISIRNPNEKIGMYFGPIAGSVYYLDEPVGPAEALAGAFYQPPKNTTTIGGTLGGGQVGEVAAAGMAADQTAGAVAFRIELSSTVRFKVSTWDTHRHKMHVSCGVKVGSDGEILPDYKEKRCDIYFF